MKSLKNNVGFLLVLMLALGFLLRFYGFSNPVADWHSWRQSETASVSRNFAQEGFDLLHPRMDNISNVQSGIDNPEGYFLVEFPLYNTFQAGFYTLFGIFTIEQWGRLVSMVSSVAAGLFIFLIVRRHSNENLGLFSTFFYMFIPFNIYYGRTILPDTMMVMSFLGSIYFFDKWLYTHTKHVKYFLLALLFTVAALLLKPHALFFLLPLVYLVFHYLGWSAFIKWQLYLFAIIAVAPLLGWRVWIMQFPEGIPANQWLLNGNGIRFRPAFFRWIFYERLIVLIGGYFGGILMALSVLHLPKIKEWLFFAVLFICPLVFVSVVATGNVQHDYYQIPAIPSIAILMAIGSYFLYQWKLKALPIGGIILVLIIAGSFYMSWSIVKEYFNINNRSLVAAGEAIQRLTPEDALVIANYNGDSAAIYQMDRKGWASLQESVPMLVKKGADFMVIYNPSEKDVSDWQKQYKVIESNEQYAIFDVTKK